MNYNIRRSLNECEGNSLKKAYKLFGIIIYALVLAILIPGKVQAAPGAGMGTIFPVKTSEYPESAVSTQQVNLNGINFIVDTYHDRILYNDSPDLGSNLFSWKVMADDFNKPHSISSDGLIYMVTDTDNSRVATYARIPTGEFIELQSFDNVGIRPHYCVYDAPTSSFYVWSSYTGEMYIYKRSAGSYMVTLSAVKKMPALFGLYTRSFTIDGNNILLCSQGAGGIVVVNKRTFAFVGAYPVPDELGGVVQVVHIGSHYYLTTSSARFGNMNMAKTVRSTSLAGFMSLATCEDVTAQLGGVSGMQIPYYITESGGLYYVRLIGQASNYHDEGCVFTEDIFGNILVLSTWP